MSRDKLFSTKSQDLVDFCFDERVVAVFPDMIRRSVPGYESLISYMGLFAGRYVKAGTYCYDLGCSRGATSLSLRERMPAESTLVAVDNAPAMIEQAQQVLLEDDSKATVKFRCEDIQATPLNNASLVTLNFTLQFIPLSEREPLLTNIYQNLNPGGALVLSEKIKLPDQYDNLMTDLHLDFKRANGYSELEISQKRQALEKVMVPETVEKHIARLESVGFKQVFTWHQSLNFISLLAVKA